MVDHKRSHSRSSRAKPIPTASSPSAHDPSASELGQSPSRASSIARLATPIAGAPEARQMPTPRQPQSGSPGSLTPLQGLSSGRASPSGPGVSSLSQALQSVGRASPLRFGSIPGQASFPARFGSPDRRAQSHDYGSFTPASYDQASGSPRASQDLEVLKRHLVGPSQRGSSSNLQALGEMSSSYGRPVHLRVNQDNNEPIGDIEGFSSLQLQGGDTTRHIYRYAEEREREQAEAEGRNTLKRSMSVNLPRAEVEEEDGIRQIKVPGGFRRDHLRRLAGSPAPSPDRRGRPDCENRAFTEPPRQRPQFVANNFIEFLTLYGHFAGEELEEDDEALAPDEYFASDANDEQATAGEDYGSDGEGWGEDSALLTPGKRKRRRRAREVGKGSPMGAALLLLKSFVGTGVLFLPRAFLNGGMLFSNLVLLFIAVLSYYCFILLVSTRLKVHASYGDMGGQIYGSFFRNMINFSLVISQIGFASAYIVFVSENLQAFILAVSKCLTYIPIQWMILIQMVVFLPLSLYRNINNIQKMALVADLFICLGLIYLYFYDIKTIVAQGGVADIKNFNPHDWTLLIGTAIFTFEGIGLIIPIQSGMRDPSKFPRVLASVMAIISVIFISMGALSYAAYGSHTKTVIILNMPQDDRLVNGVQLLYSLAILLSTPLQIYPAIEITSQQLFSRTGKYSPWIKWKKNVFRFLMVALCAAVAWAGADDLDKFVALVGSFACIPLVYIYPPLMHYRVVSTNVWSKVGDVTLCVFGVLVMAYTTLLTLLSWTHGHAAKVPGYCDEQ